MPPLVQVGFRSLTEAIDTTTSGGRLVFHIFAALAEFERAIIRERTRSGLESARARGRLGGRPPALLPADLQAAKTLLGNPDITVEEVARRLGSPLPPCTAISPAAAAPSEAGAASRPTANPFPLPHMPDSAMDEALRRYRTIRPFLYDRVPLPAIARNSGIPLRTLTRWTEKYRRQGLAGLTRRPRADKGKFRSLPSENQHLIEALALAKPRRSVSAICRAVCSRPANGKGKPSGYATVARIVQAVAPALLSLAHEGSKTYSERYDLLYRREAAAPNAIWQADHTLLDIMVLDENGNPARPCLTVIIDDYSRAIAGYFLSLKAPSAMQTALALRQAIWRKVEPLLWQQVCGIPDILYSDHGRDFISRHIEQVCADLKIRAVFSLPGQPRGRGRIERFFRTVNQRCLSTLPGYAPAAGSKYGKSAPRIAKLSLAELDAALRRYLVEDYNRDPHSATGIAPQERWNGKGFLPRLPESLEQLDLLLLTVVKPRRAQQDGIRFHGFRYLDSLLAAYVGEWVTIRYDPRDLAEIRVYYRDAFVCRAVCQELAGATVSLREIREARRQRTRELQQIIKERHHLIDFAFPKSHEVSPQEPPPHPPSGKKTAPQTHLKRYRCDR